jgi:micrococcal nuclease
MIKFFTLVLAVIAVVAACGNEVHQQDRAAKSSASSQLATVVKIVDGDTIRIKAGGQEETVRLIGIDTPETHKPGVKVECGGKQASANMTKLAPAGARVKLTRDPTQDSTDRYGRTLAYVDVVYGGKRKSLQLSQVRAGWAEVYVYDSKPFTRVDNFRAAERSAKRAHRGVWGSCSGDFHSNQPEN